MNHFEYEESNTRENGALENLGDAVMAVFGIPVSLESMLPRSRLSHPLREGWRLDFEAGFIPACLAVYTKRPA